MEFTNAKTFTEITRVQISSSTWGVLESRPEHVRLRTALRSLNRPFLVSIQGGPEVSERPKQRWQNRALRTQKQNPHTLRPLTQKRPPVEGV